MRDELICAFMRPSSCFATVGTRLLSQYSNAGGIPRLFLESVPYEIDKGVRWSGVVHITCMF